MLPISPKGEAFDEWSKVAIFLYPHKFRFGAKWWHSFPSYPLGPSFVFGGKVLIILFNGLEMLLKFHHHSVLYAGGGYRGLFCFLIIFIFRFFLAGERLKNFLFHLTHPDTYSVS